VSTGAEWRWAWGFSATLRPTDGPVRAGGLRASRGFVVTCCAFDLMVRGSSDTMGCFLATACAAARLYATPPRSRRSVETACQIGIRDEEDQVDQVVTPAGYALFPPRRGGR
jgi:hypothetical protein